MKIYIMYIILKRATLHNDYFLYFKSILMLILLWFYLNKMLNVGLIIYYIFVK